MNTTDMARLPTHGPTSTAARQPPSRCPLVPPATGKLSICRAKMKAAVGFTPEQLADNANELLSTLHKMKPSSAKGVYMRSITVASTMSPGVPVDVKSIKF